VIKSPAMTVYDWNTVPEEQMNPRLSRKVIHTAAMTIARITLQKYAVVPTHSHVNEQVSMVQRGALKFVLGPEERTLRPGEILHIPSGVEHSVEALEESVAVDLFTPAREDWIQGDDAYLRR
jgi:quercetin dioxygenase-like cupin family protein